MTIDMAIEILREADKATADAALRSAMELGITALNQWNRTQDIEYDYNSQAKMLKEMIEHFKQNKKPVFRNGVWLCPSCGRRVAEKHGYCHICGKKIGWNVHMIRKGKDGKK